MSSLKISSVLLRKIVLPHRVSPDFGSNSISCFSTFHILGLAAIKRRNQNSRIIFSNFFDSITKLETKILIKYILRLDYFFTNLNFDIIGNSIKLWDLFC